MDILNFIDFIVVLLICIDSIEIKSLNFYYKRKPIYINAGCAYMIIRNLFIEYNTGFIDVMFILNIISFIACTLSLILDTSFKDNKKLNNVSSICMMLVWSVLIVNVLI